MAGIVRSSIHSDKAPFKKYFGDAHEVVVRKVFASLVIA